MIGSVCSAIFEINDEYYFFDSHSHGSDGLSCPDGQSVLVSFHCLEDLVAFMYAVYDSMFIDISAQFNMLPISMRINTAERENPSWGKKSEAENMKHGALENRLGSHNPQTYQWKAVTDYSKKESKL